MVRFFLYHIPKFILSYLLSGTFNYVIPPADVIYLFSSPQAE